MQLSIKRFSAVHRYSRISLNRHAGFSILEVMIAIAILTTALAAIIGVIYTLHQSRTALDEEIKAQAIAQIMVERLQGARWDDLGKDVAEYPNRNAWSWHRRATNQLAYVSATGAPVVPPMTERAARDVDDLIKLGILTEPSGMNDLRVYLEYYQMSLIDSINETLLSASTKNSRQVWLEAVGNPQLNVSPSGPTATDRNVFLPEDPSEINIGQVDGAIMMRVIISWSSVVGGTHWHEVVVARRK